MIELLKKTPIDLAQGSLRGKTQGKIIALSFIKDGSNKTALDIGCREGIQSRWLEKKGYKVSSIDIEKDYEKCIVADANKTLPFKDNSFDLIWCSEVIEHLDNPEENLKEFKRVLKKEGQMILTTPNSYFWLYKIAKLFGKTPKQLQNPGHKHFFSEKHIRNLFPDAEIYGYFPYFLKKFTITKCLNFLTPTFVIVNRKAYK